MNDQHIYCVTSARSVGCTFLDWSIHWLSGQSYFYQASAGDWIPLVQDPLLSSGVSNAHGHPKNHPAGWDNIRSTVNQLKSLPSGLTSLYPVPIHPDLTCQRLQLEIQQMSDSGTLRKINQYQQDDYVSALDWLTKQDIPVIYVSVDQQATGYFWTIRSLERHYAAPRKAGSTAEKEQEYQDIFFAKSQQTWQARNLVNIWDERERLALDMRPFDLMQFKAQTFPFVYHWISCQDLWFDTERTIKRAIEWLDLPIDPSRLDPWRSITSRWQCQHNNLLRFYRMLPEIVDATIKGNYFELPSLTLQQEAIVLHCLIYQHGLNLKSWQLEHFPSNTKQLHALLEPNIHPVESYSNHLL